MLSQSQVHLSAGKEPVDAGVVRSFRLNPIIVMMAAADGAAADGGIAGKHRGDAGVG